MTNGQARLPVSGLEEVRYLIQGHSIPCPLCHLGSAITRAFLIARAVAAAPHETAISSLQAALFGQQSECSQSATWSSHVRLQVPPRSLHVPLRQILRMPHRTSC